MSAKTPTIAHWSQLSNWIPRALISLPTLPEGWRWGTVREFCVQRTEKELVDPNKIYDLAGVRWYGKGLFVRETVLGSAQKATALYPLISGSFVYNRLFAWKESFAVVPESLNGTYVSAEFPQFEVDTSQLSAEYLSLLFGTREVLDVVNAASSGSAAVSRNRFKEVDFLAMRIPIPPVEVQDSLTDQWREAVKQVIRARELRASAIESLNSWLMSATKEYTRVSRGREFSASWSSMSGWDVMAGRASAFRDANPEFIRLGDCIEECIERVDPRALPPGEWPIYGVNNKSGVFLNSYQASEKFNSTYKRIESGWFFHNPTRANVGSLGMVPNVLPNAITSPEYQVWRVINTFDPEFMRLLIETPYFHDLISFNRVGGVKQRMYFNNLAEIRLPMVSLDIQESFIAEDFRLAADLGAAERALDVAKARLQSIFDSWGSL